MYQFQLWFDGGCKPNPGQGYGSYEIGCSSGSSSYESKQSLIQFGFMTNNIAEYAAMIYGLKKLWHDSKNGSVKRKNTEIPIFTRDIGLDIHSDSKLLVQQMNGRWRCKMAHLRELEDESRLLLKEFRHWSIKWLGREHNVKRFGH